MSKERQFPVKHVVLHTPFILAGTNFPAKLDSNVKQGLEMVYDRMDKELVVKFKNQTAIIPNTNIVYMIPEGVPVVEQAQVIHRAAAVVNAQVETPSSHVTAGLGKGKTGQEANKK